MAGRRGKQKRVGDSVKDLAGRVRSKAPSERVAQLPACLWQQDTGERGWHCCASFPHQAASSSLPACKCLCIQLRCFLGFVFFLRTGKSFLRTGG